MLASLIAAFASGETMRSLRQARKAALAYALAGVAVLCGLGFLIAAAYIWAAHRYGDIEAALGFGAGFFLLAGIVLLVHKLAARSRKRAASRLRTSELTTITTAAALAALPVLMRSKGGLGAMLVPVAAIVAYAIYRENRPSGGDDPED